MINRFLASLSDAKRPSDEFLATQEIYYLSLLPKAKGITLKILKCELTRIQDMLANRALLNPLSIFTIPSPEVNSYLDQIYAQILKSGECTYYPWLISRLEFDLSCSLSCAMPITEAYQRGHRLTRLESTIEWHPFNLLWHRPNTYQESTDDLTEALHNVSEEMREYANSILMHQEILQHIFPVRTPFEEMIDGLVQEFGNRDIVAERLEESRRLQKSAKSQKEEEMEK